MGGVLDHAAVAARETVASLLTVALSVAYAFVTDVGPPIWRAVLMLALYLGTRLPTANAPS
jgi:hypothetical protein